MMMIMCQIDKKQSMPSNFVLRESEKNADAHNILHHRIIINNNDDKTKKL